MEPAPISVYKQPVTTEIAACANHPGREAIGVCIRCRTRVCSECATKVSGINYCASCLTGLATDGGLALAPQPMPAPGLAYLSAAVYTALLSALLWGFLEVVMPGGV